MGNKEIIEYIDKNLIIPHKIEFNNNYIMDLEGRVLFYIVYKYRGGNGYLMSETYDILNYSNISYKEGQEELEYLEMLYKNTKEVEMEWLEGYITEINHIYKKIKINHNLRLIDKDFNN